MQIEIDSLLEKGAIAITSPTHDQFLSHMFLREKKDGSFRPIINLQNLNQFIVYQHFKMENIPMLAQLVQKADWCVKIDLKDAYFCLSVAREHRKYMRFQWQGQTLEFQTLPFGLGSAPRTFTKIMKPVIGLLRRIGMRLMICLDDILLLNQSKDNIQTDIDIMIWLLQSLGLVINTAKSTLQPTQKVEYLGFMLDTNALTLSLSETKLEDLRNDCREAIGKKKTTVRELARLIGKLTATKLAVLPAPLHVRQLQMHKIKVLLNSSQSYESTIELTPQCKAELTWWIEHLQRWNGRALITPAPDLTITSDASKEGWGVATTTEQAQGRWSQPESQLHINVLELMAAGLALKSFTKEKRKCHVHLRLDNTTAVAMITKMGTTRSPPLLQAAKHIWDYALQKEIILTAEHLPGVTNTLADKLSRVFQDSSSWKLKKSAFNQLQRLPGPWTMDMFADRLNHQLEKYMSWKNDPNATQTDAFQTHWGALQGYAFPPFCLIDRCLAKVQRDQATVMIIAPTWQNQTWYPTLLAMAIQNPILLPHQTDLLTNGRGQNHPLIEGRNLSLAEWTVSGKNSLKRDFQRNLPLPFYRAGNQGRNPLTIPPGTNGLAGAIAGRLIHFDPLW